ncbi:MAG: kynureninase [Rudaea sp.]
MGALDAAALADARGRDDADPLAPFRAEFALPRHAAHEQVYFCGNSLGLMPQATRAALNAELDYWGSLAVEGHFRGKLPWMDYHEFVRDHLAEVVGALPAEVVAMNSLSVNLHLMMVSFYRPTAQRPAILIEKGAFPSDRYAVESQIRFHGFDPLSDLIEIDGDEDNGAISDAALERVFEKDGARIALVLLPGVQYRTGQVFDLKCVVALARRNGCAVGFDLAHSVGNVPVDLHDSGCDFAIWCSYKYLNAGPGAVAGAFVHERHACAGLPRFAGWWGHDKTTRFRMGPQFVPTPGADGWQLSNPPILALAPLRVSLEIFHRAGLARLREKSIALTRYLAELIEKHQRGTLEILTPAEVRRRGCQLSLRVVHGRKAGRALFDHLAENGVIGDWREPDVIRIAPVPLYNSYADCARFVDAVADWSARSTD